MEHYKTNHEISGPLPATARVLTAAGDVLLLDTEHAYDPSRLPVTVSVWTYVAVSVSVTRVVMAWSWLLIRVSLPLVQETVVAGPPVEVQVRVNTGGSASGSVSNWKLIAPEIVTWPPDRVNYARQVRNLLTTDMHAQRSITWLREKLIFNNDSLLVH